MDHVEEPMNVSLPLLIRCFCEQMFLHPKNVFNISGINKKNK